MLRGLGSLLMLLAGLVGLPVALVVLVGWPLPSRDEIDRVLSQSPGEPLLTVDGFIRLIACVMWIGWGLLVIAVIAEIVAEIARIRLPRLRLAAPLRRAVTALLGGLVLAIASIRAAVAPTAGPAVAVPAAGAPQVQTGADASGPLPRDAAPPAQAAPLMVPAGQITVLVADQRYTHTVAKGDTLWHIAQAWLGDPNRWPEIYALNRGRHWPGVGGRLHDPDLIYPGWVLSLPPDARPPAAAAPPETIAPPEATTPPGEPATTASGSAASAPDSSTVASPDQSRAASVPPGTAPDAGSAEAPATVGAGTPGGASAHPSTASAHPGGEDRRDWQQQYGPSAGVRLPGGWVSLPLAAAIALAGSMVWLRRRRRYLPDALAEAHPDDADLRPLPAVVGQARRRVRRDAPELLHPPRDTLTVREAAQLRRAGKPLPPPPPPAPQGPYLAGLPSALPPAGLGLIGPGSQDAVRGVLIATLCAGTPDDADARGQVVIPATTLSALLGDAFAGTGDTPRMTVTADLPAALTHIEELIISRRRLLDEEDAPDVDALRRDREHPPVPLVLLVAETPEPSMRARLSTAVRLGGPLAISAVLLGVWSDGLSLHVAADGNTDGPDAHRVAVLDTATASDLLEVLREAHTDQIAGHPSTELVQQRPEPDRREQAPPDGPVATQAGATAPEEPVEASASDGRRRAAVRVLGEPALLRLDGTPVDRLRGPALELLVYLAVHRDGATRGDLKEAIYGDATRTRAEQRLQTDVGNLRNRVRHILDLTTKDDPDPVINTGGHYHLNPDLIEVDWWRVQDSLTAATATIDLQQRETALRQARDAFGGPLAQGRQYEWMLEEDQEHIRRYGVTIHTRLATLIADADPGQAASLLDTACQLDPYNEDLARSAMRAHARTGDAQAIENRLRLLRTALGELDEEPDDMTVGLARQLVARLRQPPNGQ